MKKILFPTDFSENAQNAYVYALHLAKKLHASITTVHSYLPVHVPAEVMHHTVTDLTELHELSEMDNYQQAAQKMHQSAVKEHLENIEVNHQMEQGSMVDVVLQAVVSESPDLIIMGTKGASGLFGKIIGSNTAAIIGSAPVPVLAIPENAQYHPIQKMVLATNFEELQESAIAKAIEYARVLDAELHCVHVNVAHNPFLSERMSKLCSTFMNTPKLSFEVIDASDILIGIDRYIQEKGMDMLVMQTHRRTFFQKIFNTSYTRQMAFHVNIPLLAFK